MAKQLGRAMTLSIWNGTSSAYDFIAALNSKTLTINNTSIDVTTPDGTTPEGVLWAELLDGVKNVSISADGRFDAAAPESLLFDAADSSPPIEKFQIVVPNLKTFTGSFFIDSYELGGETTGEQTFSISLSSTGAVTVA